MPRPTDDDALGLRQIDRLLALPGTAPPASGGSPRHRRSTPTVRDRRGRRAASSPASARNAPIWNVTKCGAGPCGTTSAVSLPWNIGRTNAVAPPALLIAGDVGDERALEPRRELRREVARLIGVRQEHARRAVSCAIDALQRRDEAVRRVRLERRVLDDDRLRRRRAAASSAADGVARRRRARRPLTGGPPSLLRRGDRFPRRAIELAVALFGDDENHDSAPALRRAACATSSFAASAGDAGDHLRLLALLGNVER